MPSLKDLSATDIGFLKTTRDDSIQSNTTIVFPVYGPMIGREVLELYRELDDRKKPSSNKSVERFDLTDMIEHHYMMNPETNDIVPSAFQLLNGMSVLVEKSNNRMDLEYFRWSNSSANQNTYNQALTTNRWCEVTHLTIWNNEFVTFVGVYEDGVKIQRKYDVHDAWLVWIDSLPEVQDDAMGPLYLTTGGESGNPQMQKEASIGYREAVAQRNWVMAKDVEDRLVLNDEAQRLRESWLTPQGPYYVPPYVHEEPSVTLEYQEYVNRYKKAPEVPGNVDIVHPPKSGWFDFDVDEMDDLARWKNSHIRNADDLEMVRDDFELPLSSGRKVGGKELRELFRKEFVGKKTD